MNLVFKKIGFITILFLLVVVSFKSCSKESGRRLFSSISIASGSALDGFYFASYDRSKLIGSVFVFSSENKTWYSFDFILPNESVVLLDNLVDEIKTMKPVYAGSDMHDGEQWYVVVERDGLIQNIYCDNYFPESLVKIKRILFNLNVEWLVSARSLKSKDVPQWIRRYPVGINMLERSDLNADVSEGSDLNAERKTEGP